MPVTLTNGRPGQHGRWLNRHEQRRRRWSSGKAAGTGKSPIPQGNNLRALWDRRGKSADQDDLFMGGEAGNARRRSHHGWKVQRSQQQRRSHHPRHQAATSRAAFRKSLPVGNDLSLLYNGSAWSDVSPFIGTGDGQLTAVWGQSNRGRVLFPSGTTGRLYRVTRANNLLSYTPEAQGVTTDSLFAVSGVPGATASDKSSAVGANGRILHRGADGKWLIEANGMAAQRLNAIVGWHRRARGDVCSGRQRDHYAQIGGQLEL